MLQRLIAGVLGVLGLLAIGLGVASATVWRPDDVLVASATSDAARLITADPGVLELAGDPVTVTARTSDGSPVVIAIGRDTDVSGWVGTDASVRVTGLADWSALRTEDVAAPVPEVSAGATAEATEAPPAEATVETPAAEAPAEDPAAATPAADPTASDMWVASATGDGSATLTWTDQPGRWSLLVASLGDTPPTLELAWPRTVTTPWLWPGVVAGALMLGLGIALATRLWWRARRGLVGPEWHPVSTGAMPTVPARAGASSSVATGPAGVPLVLTRRQLREAQASTTGLAAVQGITQPGSAHDMPAAADLTSRAAGSKAAASPGPDTTWRAAATAGAASAASDRGAAPADSERPSESADAPAKTPSPRWAPAGLRPRRRDDAVSADPAAAGRPVVDLRADHEGRNREAAGGPSRAGAVPVRPGSPARAGLSSSPEQRSMPPGPPSPVDRQQAAPAAPRATGATPSWVPGRPGAVSRPDSPSMPTSDRGVRRPDSLGPQASDRGAMRPDAPAMRSVAAPLTPAAPPVSGRTSPGARPGRMAGWPGGLSGRRAPSDTSVQPLPPTPAAGPARTAAPPAQVPESPAARADAWRRAWGFPQEGAPGHDEAHPDNSTGSGDEGTDR